VSKNQNHGNAFAQHYRPALHVRYNGRSFDITLAQLDVGPLSSDREVKHALAEYFNVPMTNFRYYVVDRHTTGNLTVRPEAVFC